MAQTDIVVGRSIGGVYLERCLQRNHRFFVLSLLPQGRAQVIVQCPITWLDLQAFTKQGDSLFYFPLRNEQATFAVEKIRVVRVQFLCNPQVFPLFLVFSQGMKGRTQFHVGLCVLGLKDNHFLVTFQGFLIILQEIMGSTHDIDGCCVILVNTNGLFCIYQCLFVLFQRKQNESLSAVGRWMSYLDGNGLFIKILCLLPPALLPQQLCLLEVDIFLGNLKGTGSHLVCLLLQLCDDSSSDQFSNIDLLILNSSLMNSNDSDQFILLNENDGCSALPSFRGYLMNDLFIFYINLLDRLNSFDQSHLIYFEVIGVVWIQHNLVIQGRVTVQCHMFMAIRTNHAFFDRNELCFLCLLSQPHQGDVVLWTVVLLECLGIVPRFNLLFISDRARMPWAEADLMVLFFAFKIVDVVGHGEHQIWGDEYACAYPHFPRFVLTQYDPNEPMRQFFHFVFRNFFRYLSFNVYFILVLV